MESWLNDKSTNQTRGQLLSIYMIITFVFLGLGQLLLNISDPLKVDLFILVSVLLSFALLPILLSTTEQPSTSDTKSFSLSEFYAISPLGFVGALFTGLAHSVIFGYGAVYATAKGLSVLEVSIFMIIITSFGALSPVAYRLFIRQDGSTYNPNRSYIHSCGFVHTNCWLVLYFFDVVFHFNSALLLRVPTNVFFSDCSYK